MRRLFLVSLMLMISCMSSGKRYTLANTYNSLAFVDVMVLDENGEDNGSLGTGWFVAGSGDHSVVMTAGHMCTTDGAILSVRDMAGEKTLALVVAAVEEGALDVCLLYVPAKAPAVLRVTEKVTEETITFGTNVWYVGFPTGTLSTFSGKYTTEYHGYMVFSLSAYPGASGSPIMTDRGVVSMVSAVNRRWPNITYGVPTSALTAAQKEADEILKLATTK